MTTQTDMLAVLKSTDGKKALTAALLEGLKSTDGKNTLKAALLEGLKSTDGKNTLRSAVQAELEEGFANHKTEDPDKKEKVFENQEWLFEAVDGLMSDLKDINDAVQQIKEKV
ncbi:MAG TPA: hypothetical protein VJ140_15710 [Actinomycetota bacterium]|nr:hypothetical protein [Actinomycetota bacterium]